MRGSASDRERCGLGRERSERPAARGGRNGRPRSRKAAESEGAPATENDAGAATGEDGPRAALLGRAPEAKADPYGVKASEASGVGLCEGSADEQRGATATGRSGLSGGGGGWVGENERAAATPTGSKRAKRAGSRLRTRERGHPRRNTPKRLIYKRLGCLGLANFPPFYLTGFCVCKPRAAMGSRT